MTDKKKTKLKETGFIIAVLAFPMLNFLFFYVIINARSFVMAFQRVDANYNYLWNGLNNFKDILTQLTGSGTLLAVSFLNNLKIFFWTFIIGFPLNMIFSYYLFKKYFAHNAIRFVVMLPSILSAMVMSLLFKKFGDTALPSILTQITGNKISNLFESGSAMTMIIFYLLWTGFTSSLILYPNAMNAIDDGIIESAQLDGVNIFQELWHIIMPLIYPTITTFMVTGVSTLFTNQGPLFVFYYKDAPQHVWTMGYYLYVQTMYGAGEVAYPFMSALGLLLTIVTLPVVMGVKTLMERYDPMGDAPIRRRKKRYAKA